MGTEILRPQDCLIERLRVGPTSVLPRRKPYTAANSNSNPNPNPKFYRKTEQKKPRFPQSEKEFFFKKLDGSRSSSSSSSSVVKNDLTIGQVMILKRGESLDIKRKNEKNSTTRRRDSEDLSVVSLTSEKLGPNPEMIQKQIRITDLKSSSPVRSEVYAGSAFYLSPSPSSLPLPTFSIKKEGLAIVDDSATKDLRRLLRLD